MSREVLPLMLVAFLSLCLTCGCGGQTPPKDDGVVVAGGAKDSGGKKTDGDGAGKGKGDGAAKGKDDGPAKLPVDPKVAAAQKELDQKRRTLRALCEAAVKPGDTGKAARSEIIRQFPEVGEHVRTLLIDENGGARASACEALGKLGGAARGTVPVLREPLQGATPAAITQFDESAGQGLVVAALRALVAVAPHDAEVRQELVRAATLRDKDKDSRHGVRAAALDLLAQVARDHRAARTDAVKIFSAALSDPQLLLVAIRALPACSVEAEPAVAKLRDLEEHKSAEVRTAVANALREIDRQKAHVPALRQAGITEESVPRPLYDAAFALVEGKEPSTATEEKRGDGVVTVWTGPAKVLADAPADAARLRVLMGLAQVDKAGGRDAAPARKVALQMLTPWAAAEPAVRQKSVPLFASAGSDPATADLALRGLAACGADAVRLLQESKSPALKSIAAEFRKQAAADDPNLRAAAAEGLGALRSKEAADIEALAGLLDSKQPPAISRAAAAALQHLGKDDWRAGQKVYEKGKVNADPEVQKLVRQAVKNTGLDGRSEQAYFGSLLIHSEAGFELSGKAFNWLRRRDRDLEAFAKEADPRALDFYANAWQQHTEGYQQYAANPQISNPSSFEALEICKAFGANAKTLAPYLIDELDSDTRGRKPLIKADCAAEALGHIGPAAGPKAIAVLERAATRASTEKAKAAARAALEKVKK